MNQIKGRLKGLLGIALAAGVTVSTTMPVCAAAYVVDANSNLTSDAYLSSIDITADTQINPGDTIEVIGGRTNPDDDEYPDGRTVWYNVYVDDVRQTAWTGSGYLGEASGGYVNLGDYTWTAPDNGGYYEVANIYTDVRSIREEDGVTKGNYYFILDLKSVVIRSQDQAVSDNGSSAVVSSNDNTPATDNSYEARVQTEKNLSTDNFNASAVLAALPADVKEAAGIKLSEDGSSLISSVPVFNLSQIRTAEGFAAAIGNVSKAVTGETLMIYTQSPVAFTNAALETISNSGQDFVYMFTYKGKSYVVTIPKGTKITLDGSNCEGPLYIGAKYGKVEVLN